MKGYVDIKKQCGKRDFRKDVNSNEARFELFKDISDLNSKFSPNLKFSFPRSIRNTDFPGVVTAKDPQRRGRDLDFYVDSNPDYLMKSEHLGMVDMSRTNNNRLVPEKTYKMPGKINFEGIG